MNWYSRHVFPLLCDLVMNNAVLAQLRRELLRGVAGDILEIGVGTGLNLAHYPGHVRRISTVDPNVGMSRLLKRRIAQSGLVIDHHILSSESLPFPAGRFDCVVSTWTMCSIANLPQALREIGRVLKPGGRLFFLEHGLSPNPAVQRWQRRLNGLEGLLADGCRLDINFRALLSAQPFDGAEIETFQVRQIPPTHGSMYRGIVRTTASCTDR